VGWYYTYGATRASTVAELTEARTSANPDGTTRAFDTLRHCLRGNVLWTLHRSMVVDDVGVVLDQKKWIGCYLLQRSSDGWGYKPMDEDMGPYYFTCPVSYLDQADPPSTDNSREWRDKVRARANAEGDRYNQAVKVMDALAGARRPRPRGEP
jgi:hypothetical protein